MSVIRVGKNALSSRGNGKFVRVTESEPATIVPLVGLDDLISINQHSFWEINPAIFVPCIGPNCPACKLGNNPRFKAFLPVLTKENGTQIFSFGIQVLRQLESLEEELGSIVGQAIKVKRHGGGLSTKYTVIAIGRKVSTKDVETPDVIEAIGPTDEEGIKRVLVEAGLMSSSEAKTSSKKELKAKQEVESEDEAEIDESWESDEDQWEEV